MVIGKINIDDFSRKYEYEDKLIHVFAIGEGNIENLFRSANELSL